MISDFEIAKERAAHELEWMARGYAAWLMTPLLETAKLIRKIPEQDLSYDGTLTFIAGFCDSSADVSPLYDTSGRHPLRDAAERLINLPRDPRDEPWCQRKDGIMPSHIKAV